MEVTLLGTGDTTGTPTVGCDCGTCGTARERGVERTRFSVHVRNETTDETLLIDLSPDFRYQFLREELSVPDAAVVTHIHFDHLHGAGNVFRLTRQLPVYAPDERDPATGESVADTVATRYDYLDALDVRARAPLATFEAAGMSVTLVPVEHPPLLCYGLTVEHGGSVLALTGDTSYAISERARERFHGADLLLADGIVHAAYCENHPLGGADHDPDGVPRTFGTKHMTVEGATQLCEELGVDRYRLVHVSHFLPPDRAFAEPLAVDGERYTL